MYFRRAGSKRRKRHDHRDGLVRRRCAHYARRIVGVCANGNRCGNRRKGKIVESSLQTDTLLTVFLAASCLKTAQSVAYPHAEVNADFRFPKAANRRRQMARSAWCLVPYTGDAFSLHGGCRLPTRRVRSPYTEGLTFLHGKTGFAARRDASPHHAYRLSMQTGKW